MKHYVLGFYFDCTRKEVLLIQKLRPDWMHNRWNGIGGKIESNETAPEAMQREAHEEASIHTFWAHTISFLCPGGTVYVFRGFAVGSIEWVQEEDEEMRVFQISNMPAKRMGNLDWLIPLSLGDIEFPVLVHQLSLGI